MNNDRPIHNLHIQESLDRFKATCAAHDLVGCVMFADADEMGFAYHVTASWNANVKDLDMPLGFRMQTVSSQRRVSELLAGTVHTSSMLLDFGCQTLTWGQDLTRILLQSGVHMKYTLFKGEKPQNFIN